MQFRVCNFLSAEVKHGRLCKRFSDASVKVSLCSMGGTRLGDLIGVTQHEGRLEQSTNLFYKRFKIILRVYSENLPICLPKKV
jgi:hypothetical protein